MTERTSPLAGVRVVDLSQVLAGPYVARVLADLGADVIKVEAPAGDLSRLIAPRRDRGMSGLYTWVNVGKRNVCVDLTTEAGKRLVLALIAKSDIVIENFRCGVADRLGVGWTAVQAANPRAVMVSVSGYGADSSLRDRGAFAPSIHAFAGLLEYQARKLNQPIRPLPDSGADITTAMHAVIAALAALRVAERTGQGDHVEVSMYDAVLAAYAETAFELLDPPEPRPDTEPYNAGANGWFVVAGPPAHVWLGMSKSFGIKDPAPADADLETKGKLRHTAMEGWMAAQPSAEALIATLEKANLPCAPIRTLREALTGAFAQERELLTVVDDRRGGTRPVVRSPYRFDRLETAIRGPAPRQGEHNTVVLVEVLGMSAAEVAALEAQGVLKQGTRSE
jgi:CoA:oxalate CoA-transferase